MLITVNTQLIISLSCIMFITCSVDLGYSGSDDDEDEEFVCLLLLYDCNMTDITIGLAI